MEEDFFRKDMSVPDNQDRRPLPRVLYNDADVQNFRRCLAHYMSGDYQSAVSEMRVLRSRYLDVVHLHLNELITKFYLSRCVGTEELLAEMKDAMTKAYGPNFENGRVRDLTQVGYLYNYALVLFYLMRHNQSLAIMQIVMRYFETLEDGLVRDCCFLLLELYLVLYQIAEAMSTISYLEEEFDESTGLRINLPESFRQDSLLFDENSQLFRPMPTFKAKVQLILSGDMVSLLYFPPPAVEMAGSRAESYQPQLESDYKVRIANTLWIQSLSKKESKGLLTTHGISSANPVPVYLKSQSEFNRGNFAKAVKLLNHLAPLPATATPSVSGDCYPSLFYNNLACINSAMGKSTIAAVYFNMALEENTKAMQGLPPAGPNGLVDYNQVPLQSIGTSRFSEFVYNLGTQLLISGQPTQAFPLLVEASHTYHQNPRLWCRLAEACIAKHKNDVIDPLHRRKPTRYMVKGLVGAGKYRKLLLSAVLLPYQKQLAQRKVPPATEVKKDPSEPALTIEFARMCLINALATVNRHLNRPAGIDEMHPIAPSGITSKQEILTLKAYILVNLAFVSNCLWDFVGGIEYSRQAETIPDIPGVLRFLVSAYASEALIRVNRLQEAGHYLSVPYINNVFRQMNVDLDKEGQVNMIHHARTGSSANPNATPSSGNPSSRNSEEMNGDEQANAYDQPGAVIKSFLHVPNDYLRKRPLFARNLLGYNHAVWLAMNGDLEASYTISEKLRSAETNADSITRARATQLCIYIRFRQENHAEATKLIMDECPEWKDRLSKDFDEDEKKLRQLRELQGIPWPLDS